MLTQRLIRLLASFAVLLLSCPGGPLRAAAGDTGHAGTIVTADGNRLTGSVRFDKVKVKIVFNEGKGDTQTIDATQVKVVTLDRQVAAAAIPKSGTYVPATEPKWH
ncbi:MAG: hypothetical protein ACI8XO_001970 [Verrucomicrobiales bacterium]|jgi:hypothetical protein